MFIPVYGRKASTFIAKAPRVKNEVKTYSSDLVWAAAVVADRINGGKYVKQPEYNVEEEIIVEPNKVLVKKVLAGDIAVTDADIELGQTIRKYLSKQMLMKTLKGKTNNSDFDQSLIKLLEAETLQSTDYLELAIVASQPLAYYRLVKTEEAMEDVVREAVAEPGQRVNTRVTVIKCVYSMNYNVHFVSAKTESNRMVFFSQRIKMDVDQTYNIRGTVGEFNGETTRLRRVKVL